MYSDDFHDSKTGWADSSLNTADDTFNFTASGYVIGSSGGSIEHWIYSPYRDGKGQLSMSLTATQMEGPAGLGFGVACGRGDGATRITYSFLILNDGTFTVARSEGSLYDSPEVLLQKGASPVKPGSTAITVVGMCATLDDGKTTRLVLFAGDQMLADFTDKTSLSGPGWLGSIDMLSGKRPSSITAKHWEERDLSA